MSAAGVAARPRIWEVDREALSLIAGVLLHREEVERVLARFGGEAPGRIRGGLLDRCKAPGPLAEALERELDVRAAGTVPGGAERPMIQLVEWWAEARERASLVQQAAFLWTLSRDGRCFLAPLVEKVRSALREAVRELLGRHRAELGEAGRAAAAEVLRPRAAP